MKGVKITIALVAVLAAGAAIVTHAGADNGPPPLVCGVLDPVDRILHCPKPHSQGTPEQEPQQQEQAPTAEPAQAAPTATVTAQATLQTSPVRHASAKPQFVRDELLVHFKPGTSPAQARAMVKAAGGRVDSQIPHLGVYVVVVAPAKRDLVRSRLDKLQQVEKAERDVVFHAFTTTPNDAHWSLQWGLRLVGLPAVWDRIRGSAKVTVAVLDTGVDPRHPDLAGALVRGENLVAPGTAPADEDGHGTAVAGVIAARSNNSQGEAGVCWTCRILPVKTLKQDGAGKASDTAAGIVKAVDRGARVINLSLGGPVGTQTLADAVAYAIGKGRVVVSAAGNEHTSHPTYPAAYPGVLGVAGLDPASHLYGWSNRGSWVRVSAPGCNVATQRGGGYEMFCGTSSAAPLVAGLAALAVAAKPSASGAQITNAIARSAQPGKSVDARAMLAALGVKVS